MSSVSAGCVFTRIWARLLTRSKQTTDAAAKIAKISSRSKVAPRNDREGLIVQITGMRSAREKRGTPDCPMFRTLVAVSVASRQSRKLSSETRLANGAAIVNCWIRRSSSVSKNSHTRIQYPDSCLEANTGGELSRESSFVSHGQLAARNLTHHSHSHCSRMKRCVLTLGFLSNPFPRGQAKHPSN